MTEKETYMLEMFRSLDRHEQNIIMGKISEMILNRKREKISFFESVDIKRHPMVFVFIFKSYPFIKVIIITL